MGGVWVGSVARSGTACSRKLHPASFRSLSTSFASTLIFAFSAAASACRADLQVASDEVSFATREDCLDSLRCCHETWEMSEFRSVTSMWIVDLRDVMDAVMEVRAAASVRTGGAEGGEGGGGVRRSGAGSSEFFSELREVAIAETWDWGAGEAGGERGGVDGSVVGGVGGSAGGSEGGTSFGSSDSQSDSVSVSL